MKPDTQINGKSFVWDAPKFFKGLMDSNKLARGVGFVYRRVSSLAGFEEALASMQSRAPLLAVSDTTDGFTALDTSPHTRRIHTVFISMPHKIDDMQAREKCLSVLRELFRQFMTLLIREKVTLLEQSVFLDEQIRLTEIDSFFFNGAACCYFQVAVETFTDLTYNPDEWL